MKTLLLAAVAAIALASPASAQMLTLRRLDNRFDVRP
jgi:hypothetical protein